MEFSSMGLNFNPFQGVLAGFHKHIDQEGLAEQLLDYLAWLAIAGECNSEAARSAYVDHLFRAYPLLGESAFAELDQEQAFTETAANLQEILVRQGPQALNTVKTALSEEDALRSFVGEVNERVIGRPLKCCVYEPNRPSETGGREDVWLSVGPFDPILKKRHAYLNAPPHTKLVQLITFKHETCEFHATRIPVHEFMPNQYRIVTKGPPSGKNRSTERYLKPLIDNAYAVALKRRYDWEVEFALSPERTGIVVTTNAQGVKEMLSTKDKIPRGRRGALLHWVREHYRRSRTSPDEQPDFQFIQTYMRGKMECEYGGMWCRIYPAIWDVERAGNTDRMKKKLLAGR